MLDSTLRDDGISGYTGKNLTHGALGKFLAAIKVGLVSPGSTLLVENLDRLSRDEIFTAMGVFNDIILSGVRIISMMDRQEYTAETIRANPYQLMYTIGAFVRGHEESQTKSKRIRAAFANRRKNLDTVRWKTKLPPWLKFNSDKTGFIVDDNKAQIIRRIFTEYSSGVSVTYIARKLTNEKIGRPSDGVCEWATSNIQYYLKSRTVIGEFQPSERKGKGRIASGEPHKDYYPAIVDPALFARVNRMMSQKMKVKGRSSPEITNLFKGILRCPYCGDTVLLRRNRTTSKHRSEVYVCDRAFRHQTCISYGWDREDLETTFLKYAENLHAEYANVTLYKPTANNELPGIVDRLLEIEQEETRLMELYQKGRVQNVAKIQGMLDALHNERQTLSNRRAELEHSTSGRNEKVFKFDLEQLLNADLKDPDKRDILAGCISRLFSRIDLYFVGLPSRYNWIKQRQSELSKKGLKRNSIYFQLRRESPFMDERFFLGVTKEVGAKLYPDIQDDNLAKDFFALYEDNAPDGADPEKEFKEILAAASKE
jgi:DNA invertase Pin-like site-specific DNA recombinase/predicted RNA-binding Zn-ribbon protein involved in translation (DUF1610 family)